MKIIEKFGNDKRDTQPVPLINFENDLTSPNKSNSETDPKSDEQQQSNDNKQFPQKNSVRTVRKKMALTQFQLLIV